MMIDITVPLKKGMDVYEEDPDFEMEPVCSLENGDEANVSKLTLSSHAGTHIDAPSHYLKDGSTIDEIDISALNGECQVVEIKDEFIEGNLIVKIPEIKGIERILFKTRNSLNPGVFSRDAVAISLDVVQQLIKENIKLVGVDGFSVEIFGGNGDVHRALLKSGIIILETLDLSQVLPGTYELMCLPIKILGCDAAPARAILKSH